MRQPYASSMRGASRSEPGGSCIIGPMRLVCAATKRIHGRGLAAVLTDIARHWEEWVLSLAVGRAAAYE